MTVKTKAVRNAEIDATYINNITQDTENSDLNQTYKDNADSSISIAAGEPEQSCQGVVDFVDGLKSRGKDVVSMCNTVNIHAEQDWIDNSTLIAAGKYQLIADKTYVICGSVSRSIELFTNGFNTIVGVNPNIDIDIYTGAGIAWSDLTAFSGLTIIRCSSKGVQGSGSKFIAQSNGAFIISTDTAFIEFDDLGVSDAIINVHSKVAFGSLSIPLISGYSITSTNAATILFDNCAFRLTDLSAVTAIDLISATSISSIEIASAFRGGAFAGSIAVRGSIDSGNLVGDARGLIRDSNFRTVDIPLSGITVDDLKWTLRDNDGAQDTMPDAHATCMDRTAYTSTLNGVPIEIGGGAGANAWIDIDSSQFTLDTATGRVTYDGLDPMRVPVDFGCTLVPQSGSNKNIYIYVGFGNSGDANPTRLIESRSETRVDSSDPKPLSTFTQVTFHTGDYVSAMVELKAGESNTDILCTNNKLRVN